MNKYMTQQKKGTFFTQWGKRAISLRGRIDQKMVEKVHRRLEFFLKKNSTDPIRLVLNSHGGHISASIRLSVILNSAQSHCPIEIYVLKAKGVSTLVLVSGTPGLRIAYPFSTILPKISLTELHEDPNLSSFVKELLEKQNAFTLESCFYPFSLTQGVVRLRDDRLQKIYWHLLTKHFSSPNQNVVRRSFEQLSEGIRNNFIMMKLYGGVFSEYSGIAEESVYYLLESENTLALENAMDIGLIDVIDN